MTKKGKKKTKIKQRKQGWFHELTLQGRSTSFMRETRSITKNFNELMLISIKVAISKRWILGLFV